jgi:hypothetical protein
MASCFAYTGAMPKHVPAIMMNHSTKYELFHDCTLSKLYMCPMVHWWNNSSDWAPYHHVIYCKLILVDILFENFNYFCSSRYWNRPKTKLLKDHTI